MTGSSGSSIPHLRASSTGLGTRAVFERTTTCNGCGMLAAVRGRPESIKWWNCSALTHASGPPKRQASRIMSGTSGLQCQPCRTACSDPLSRCSSSMVCQTPRASRQHREAPYGPKSSSVSGGVSLMALTWGGGWPRCRRWCRAGPPRDQSRPLRPNVQVTPKVKEAQQELLPSVLQFGSPRKGRAGCSRSERGSRCRGR